eukprot:TRINITY_DN25317_c0_g1_i1.p1 TRINITY_DN25317_c0_g1~~TRINITY_DN25317_c0_g1_i1.p1  ORF type:complete len:199 (+),score=26.38 TRINITY_DN25317_c0_g1_i1:49-597(+)
MSLGFCPVPHKKEHQIWLGVGLLSGVCLARTFLAKRASKQASSISVKTPTRVFKLATKAEVEQFRKLGRIESGLDKADGFVHLSDRTAPPKVASLFFKGATDLYLLELDASKFLDPVHWFVGVMGDAPPSKATRDAEGRTGVHYLMADGCVHVYNDVSTDCIVREAAVPLGADGVHVFPDWL